MDKQRIFWVILAVTGLAVIVLVGGVFLLRPKATGDATPIADTGVSPYEYQKEPSTAPELRRNEPEVVRIVIGEQPPKSEPAAPGAAAEAVTAAPRTEPRTEPRTAPAAKPAVKPAPAPAAKPAEKAAAKPAAKPAVPRTEYWIQAASYRSQSAAEDLSRRLSEKGLAGRVISSDQRSETWFRVRIGPYGNKQEAEKFLDLVRQIKGLEASYVSQVTAPGA